MNFPLPTSLEKRAKKYKDTGKEQSTSRDVTIATKKLSVKVSDASVKVTKAVKTAFQR